MDNRGLDIFDLTESESSSSYEPPLFDTNQPFVLELHELKKDEPAAANPQETKAKKLKKKKKQLPAKNDRSSASSSSISQSSVPPTVDALPKEEFYDAHESYHELLAENLPVNPVAAAAILQVHSEHGQDPKITEQQAATAQPAAVTDREPSTVSKPVTRPASK